MEKVKYLRPLNCVHKSLRVEETEFKPRIKASKLLVDSGEYRTIYHCVQ